jgi:hypothetical protein
MKKRFLPFALAALTLASCGGQPASSSHPTGLSTSESHPTGLSASEQSTGSSTSSEPALSWVYLDFLQGEKPLRIDVLGVDSEIHISYGNAALSSQINNLTLNDSARLSATGSAAADKTFNAIIVKEGQGWAGIDLKPGIEGDKITDLFDIIDDTLVGASRAYVAFSMGPTQWTKNLNAAMDTFIQSRLNA